MKIHIIDDGVLEHLDFQLVRTSNQKLDVPSLPSGACIEPRKESVLDTSRFGKKET